MPFVSEKSNRVIEQSFGQYEHKKESSFGEVFTAALGQVIDEDLSISIQLNREGFDARNKLIDDKIKSGDIPDVTKFRTKGGRSRHLDYGRIAASLNDPEIKTDDVLTQERNELLAQRREYADDVIERGSGLAQFAGSMNAYMLDPLNIATVGIATPVTASKALTTLGKVALTARNAALLDATIETGLQAFIYEHKQAIDSPYDASDALANIGMAATGAAALSGGAVGLSSWLTRVLKIADEVPKTKDTEAAKEYLERIHETVKSAPKADTPEQQLQVDLDYLGDLENKAEESALATKSVDQYESVTPQTKPSSQPTTERERSILNDQGMSDVYDQDLEAFNRLDNPIVEIDGQQQNATDIIQAYDDELAGLDSVLSCVYKGAA